MAACASSSRCSLCPFQARDKSHLINHVCRIHSHDPKFLIYCSDCLRSFTVWETYKKHRYRGCRVQDTPIQLDEQQEDGLRTHFLLDESNVNELDPEAGHSASVHVGVTESNVWQAAKFILSVKERHALSQSAVDTIVASTQSLICSLNEGILREIRETNELSDSALTLLESKFQRVDSLFAPVSTAHRQQKFFEECFHRIVPTSKQFPGNRYVWKRGTSRRKRRLVKVKDSFQYISLQDSLKALLLNSDVRRDIEGRRPAPPGVFRDFMDGKFIKEHPSASHDSLFFAVYFDELETANPLGSKRGKHKLGMFYWALLNIHPAHRSALDCLQLLAVAKASDLKAYGMDCVLKPMVDELQTLAKGISVTFHDGTSKVFKGYLVAFLGDTPAAALVGGFKEGVGGAYRCCRTCMIESAHLSSSLEEECLSLRTLRRHKKQCKLLNLPDSSKEYGINRLSLLIDAPCFDLCQCMPHDIMHVILEGVLPLHVKLLLTHCIYTERYFTLKTLNRLLSEFEYGYTDEKNIPRQLDVDHLKSQDSKLSQSASQMWLLGRLLPVIVGTYVPDRDPYWKCFIQLLRILTISTAVEITCLTVSTLSLLVKDYLTSFTLLYPGVFTPKLHYLLHLPHQMELFGPLRHQWCMRFEGKNAFLKRFVGNNFKNLALTLAKRHQNYMCLQLLSPNYLYRGDEIGKVTHTICEDETLPVGARNILVQSFPTTSLIPSASSVRILGKDFRPGALVCLRYPDNEEYPLFGSILRICLSVTHHKTFLLCLYDTECYSPHFHAYQITKTTNFKLVRIQDLAIHEVYHKYIVRANIFTVIKSCHHVDYDV